MNNHKNASMSPSQEELFSLFSKRLKLLGLPLSCEQIKKLSCYVELLLKWNSVHNLTSITDPSEIADKHLADSLAVAPFLEGECFADVGSGAGFPGIPLAVALPFKKFTLIDSRAKRTSFLRQVKIKLNLANVDVITARVETLEGKMKFDGVMSRAFSQLGLFASLSKGIVAPGGKFYAMKGILSDKERKSAENEFGDEFSEFRVERLKVPDSVGNRHLVIMSMRP